MAENTKIQWAQHTFNPWRGCTRVSPGCVHCYAERQSKRNPGVLGRWGLPTAGGTRVLAAEAQWREPVKWNINAAEDRDVTGVRREYERPRVFCASIADVFEDWTGPVQNARGEELCRSIAADPASVRPTALTRIGGGVQVRADNQVGYTITDARARLFALIAKTPNLDWLLLTKRPENVARMMPAGEYPNVWLGTTVECQEYAWRLDALREARDSGIKVPVLFCSAEPLLGELNIRGSLGSDDINWVICGGESGGGAREFNPNWAKSLLDQCRAAGVPFFMKQLGENVLTSTMRPTFGLTTRPPNKGGDWNDLPRPIRVRDVPAPRGELT